MRPSTFRQEVLRDDGDTLGLKGLDLGFLFQIGQGPVSEPVFLAYVLDYLPIFIFQFIPPAITIVRSAIHASIVPPGSEYRTAPP